MQLIPRPARSFWSFLAQDVLFSFGNIVWSTTCAWSTGEVCIKKKGAWLFERAKKLDTESLVFQVQ